MSILLTEREAAPCVVSLDDVAHALAARHGLTFNVATSAVVAVFGSSLAVTVTAAPQQGCEAALEIIETHARLFPGLLSHR